MGIHWLYVLKGFLCQVYVEWVCVGEIFGFTVRIYGGHFWVEDLGLRIVP